MVRPIGSKLKVVMLYFLHVHTIVTDVDMYSADNAIYITYIHTYM